MRIVLELKGCSLVKRGVIALSALCLLLDAKAQPPPQLSLPPVQAMNPTSPTSTSSYTTPRAVVPEETTTQRAGTATITSTVSMDVLDDVRPMTRGDVLNFRILEDRDPPVSLRVADSGEVEVPYIGRIYADGKTLKSFAYEVKSILERDYYHHATVIASLDIEGQRSPGRIYLSGAVAGGGPQDIPPNEKFTVSKAILRAGGFTDFANQRKVRLTRTRSDGTTETKTVDVKEVIEKGRQEVDVEVQANDFIVVPERLINF